MVAPRAENFTHLEPLKGHRGGVRKFFNSLMHFMQEGTFKATHITWTPVECMTHPQPGTTILNSKNAMNVKRQWHSKSLPSNKFTLLRDGTSFISMAQPNTSPRPVGWGVLAVATRGTGNSSPLDTLEKQTNSRAELQAAISAVVKVSQKILFFGDSTYVLDGVAGKTYTWQRL